MSPCAPDPLPVRLRDWATGETEGQETPLTPAMLRLRLRLAQRDARSQRLRRLQGVLLLVPALILLKGAMGGATLGVRLLEQLLSAQAGTLMVTGLFLGLLVCLSQIWSAE